MSSPTGRRRPAAGRGRDARQSIEPPTGPGRDPRSTPRDACRYWRRARRARRSACAPPPSACAQMSRASTAKGRALSERITPTYARATWVFLRLLGLVYVFAFASLAVQIVGLVGQDGILPARLYMDAARSFAASEQLGLDKFRILPTLGWIGPADSFLRGLCLGGVALAGLLAAGIAPLVVLPILWLDYLSLMVVGRDFLSFQWDALLVEMGLLAIALAPFAWRDRW